MIYVVSLCLFFIIFPTSIAVIKNIFFLISGPKENNVYHIESYKTKKKKTIIELVLEIMVLIVLFYVFIQAILNSVVGL
jgi:hypothetical protein